MDIKRIGLRIMSIMKLDQEWFAFAYTCYSRCIGWLKHDDWTFLRGVSFELMEPCNRKCSYCPVSSMPPRAGKMSEELFDKVIDDLCDMDFSGVVEYAFYGEPLLDTRLPWFISRAKAKLPQALHRVYTNGDLLTAAVYESLDRAGVDYIVVTDHDNRPDAAARFAAFPKVRFQQAKELHLLNRGGLVKVNQQPFSKVLRWLSKRLLGGCSQAAQPIIGYNGIVHLCCQDALKTTNLGDLTKESLSEIMAHSRPLRKAALSGRYTLDMCKKCSNFSADT